MRSKLLLAFSALALTLAFARPATADGFSNGEFVSYEQGDWAVTGVGNSLLNADYESVYAGSLGAVIVGSDAPGQFAMLFTSATAINGFLVTDGTPSALTASVLNPSQTSTGIFGGDVLALALNVDFSNAGYLHGTSSTPFGDLVLANYTGSLAGLNGLTVTQFLAIANTCLGDGSCPYGLENIATITTGLNDAFDEGVVTPYAANLALPASTTPAPEPPGVALLGAGLLGLLAFAKLKPSSGRFPSSIG
jgi:hypothetical protein